MEQTKKDTSIIIVTRNAEKYIGDSLSIIFNQDTDFSYEVIVIDSSSTDKTTEIIKTFPLVRLITIKQEEFGHGKTRNSGASLASAKYLVFLNGDATPKNKIWLSSLLENFKDEKVAGIYSRQISRNGTYVGYILEQQKILGQIKLVKELNNTEDIDRATMLELIRFSTVSCAIKKEIWERSKFNENLFLAEDQEWAKEVLKAGYKIIYEPKSVVFHSHNYTLKEKFVYYYNCSVCFNKILSKKEFQDDIFMKIFIKFPATTLAEIPYVIYYCKKNKYGLFKTFREIVIAFLLRISGILGTVSGSIKRKID